LRLSPGRRGCRRLALDQALAQLAAETVQDWGSTEVPEGEAVLWVQLRAP
jgi:hypothetical protein